MAWPPSIPPNTRTNAAVEVDVHPADHNAAATALADLTTRLTSAAWGIIPGGYAKVTTTSPAISSSASPGTLVPGASCAVTCIAGRRYKVKWTGELTADGSNVFVAAVILRNGVIIQRRTFSIPSAAAYTSAPLEIIDAPGAGAFTYTVNYWRAGGTLSIYNVCSATETSELTVMDIGPVVPT